MEPPHADPEREGEHTKARDDGLNRRPAPGPSNGRDPRSQPSVGLRPVGQPFALGVAMAGDRREEGPRVSGAVDHASEAAIVLSLAVACDTPALEHLQRTTGDADRLAVAVLLADEIADGVGMRIERCKRGLIGRKDDCVEKHRRAVLVGRIDRQLTTVRSHRTEQRPDMDRHCALRGERLGERAQSAEPRSPATVEKRANTGVRLPFVKTLARLRPERSAVHSK